MLTTIKRCKKYTEELEKSGQEKSHQKKEKKWRPNFRKWLKMNVEELFQAAKYRESYKQVAANLR